MWVDESYITVEGHLQKELNKLYAESLDLADLSADQLIEEGDHFKYSEDWTLAIKYYEEAIKKATKETIAYILPRITSCYRKKNMAYKAIELFSFAKEKFGSGMMSSALLTSAAAAFCDMQEYEKARKCAKRAYAMEKGKAPQELINVFSRIKKEYDEK